MLIIKRSRFSGLFYSSRYNGLSHFSTSRIIDSSEDNSAGFLPSWCLLQARRKFSDLPANKSSKRPPYLPNYGFLFRNFSGCQRVVYLFSKHKKITVEQVCPRMVSGLMKAGIGTTVEQEGGERMSVRSIARRWNLVYYELILRILSDVIGST